MIQLTQEEFNDLIEDRNFLNALRAAGVDNWSGYDFAIELYEQDYTDD